MQLETIKHSLFTVNPVEAGAVVGGQVAPAHTFFWADCFTLDGTILKDPVEAD